MNCKYYPLRTNTLPENYSERVGYKYLSNASDGGQNIGNCDGDLTILSSNGRREKSEGNEVSDDCRIIKMELAVEETLSALKMLASAMFINLGSEQCDFQYLFHSDKPFFYAYCIRRHVK